MWPGAVDDVQHFADRFAKNVQELDARTVPQGPRMDAENLTFPDIHAELANLDLGHPAHNVVMLLSHPIATALQCSICEDIIHNAYKCLECMHSYCYSCLMSKIEIGNPKNICPVNDCGSHDIDGFTPTFLGPNPLTGSKPRVLPDSLLSGIVKKVFSFEAGGHCQQGGAFCTEGFVIPKTRSQSTSNAQKHRCSQATKQAELTRVTQDMKPVSKKDVNGEKCVFELKHNTSDIVSQGKPNAYPALDHHTHKARTFGPPQSTALLEGLCGTRKETSRRLVGRKRAGSMGFGSQGKRPFSSQQTTLASLLSIGLFPVDALDNVQKLPNLENNYMRLPLSTPLEVLLAYIRNELRSTQMVLFCRDRLLMQDLDKPLEWVRKEIWLPKNDHHDVFSLYYSDSNILPEAHWLRDQ